MTILVTGATGRIGRHVVSELLKRDAKVRVLTRDAAKADFPAGVEVVQGEFLDLDAMRAIFTDDLAGLFPDPADAELIADALAVGDLGVLRQMFA